MFDLLFNTASDASIDRHALFQNLVQHGYKYIVGTSGNWMIYHHQIPVPLELEIVNILRSGYTEELASQVRKALLSDYNYYLDQIDIDDLRSGPEA